MTTLIRIGNSQGVRIPKAIIEQAQLDEKELEFKVLDEGLLIKPVRKHRQGWQKQFEKFLKTEKEEELDQEWLDAYLVEDEDWEW
ncbi:antitoxin MazE [Desulfocicer vacuolatum DSM 3385]|uniref:Antitoxin MazE n=1 Tax=Desulfocicer vacuolatum DSM 3385 TaxID=1121400 RepID=A0A1W2EER6_9BACT|nr:AbrB/MazE/SpoVT family DNA-binding domain-containing protein [Desulfocicer vacuolatum]SMD07796.1 antitoxin MazE [Desulfocicer vacuolatum DSM 3385]